ncbi:MAG: hypothetical protein V7637_1315 [Mycobacteriales bacterium]|jgi:hypothetical protein
MLASATVPAIQIRRVSTDLHERLRRKAEAAHVSVNQYVLRLLEHDVGQSPTSEWLASLAEREPVPDVDLTALLDEARQERDAQFARVLRH